MMHSTMHHVVEVINRELKDEFLKFPTNQELRDIADRNFEKYKLPYFGYAVDGCHFVFKEKPRGLPQGRIFINLVHIGKGKKRWKWKRLIYYFDPVKNNLQRKYLL